MSVAEKMKNIIKGTSYNSLKKHKRVFKNI